MKKLVLAILCICFGIGMNLGVVYAEEEGTEYEVNSYLEQSDITPYSSTISDTAVWDFSYDGEVCLTIRLDFEVDYVDGDLVKINPIAGPYNQYDSSKFVVQTTWTKYPENGDDSGYIANYSCVVKIRSKWSLVWTEFNIGVCADTWGEITIW